MNAANAIAVKVIREALENPNREIRVGACTEQVHIGYDLQQQKWVYMCCDFRDTNCVFGIYTLIFSVPKAPKPKLARSICNNVLHQNPPLPSFCEAGPCGWGQRDRLWSLKIHWNSTLWSFFMKAWIFKGKWVHCKWRGFVLNIFAVKSNLVN